MEIILFDQEKVWNQLKPLTLNRPVSHLRVGIFSIYQKWELKAEAKVSFLTPPYLASKYESHFQTGTVYVSSEVFPTARLIVALRQLEIGEALYQDERLIALKSDVALSWPITEPEDVKKVTFSDTIDRISFPEDLFLQNGNEIVSDFEILTSSRTSELINDRFTKVYNVDSVFVEKGASIKAAIINAEEGPVYIGENAIIQEGSVLIGPVSIGTNAKVGYNAIIRQNTTIGPDCRVAGEVSNCIFMANSNKSHDGFLGNSVVGEWCNFGANTNGSNLKNNYKNVKLYDYATDSLRDIKHINCGSIVGDFNKFGISTMLNTGTTIGVSCHVYGAGFQAKNIPSFSWGGPEEYALYNFDKAIEVINATMSRKGLVLDKDSIEILRHISNHSKIQKV